MKNINSKRNKRVEFKPIPLYHIPEGIQLCIKNTERLYDDAMFLLKNKRVASAQVNFILAKEEFAKVLFLLSHFKQKKNYFKNPSEKIFSKSFDTIRGI